MRKQSPTYFITRTGLLLALALIFQIGLRSLAQPAVGPMVNFVLIFSALTVGTASGVIIGMATPLIAFFVGITPLFPIVPFIMAGNALFVLCFNWIRRGLAMLPEVIGLVVASLVKFGFLAISVRYLVTFFVPQVPAPLVASMSIPQLYTALIGGALAIGVSKVVLRATRQDGIKY